jgi:hypothetical protein
MASELTFRQRELVNFMRGNGGVLDDEGRKVLKARLVWSDGSITRGANQLVKKGLAAHLLGFSYGLTEEGRRV